MVSSYAGLLRYHRRQNRARPPDYGRGHGAETEGRRHQRSVCEEVLKGQNPIGQHFGPDKIKYSATFEIVGVVRDMRYMTYDYKDPVRPMFWLPEAQTVQYDDPAYTSGETASHSFYNTFSLPPANP